MTPKHVAAKAQTPVLPQPLGEDGGKNDTGATEPPIDLPDKHTAQAPAGDNDHLAGAGNMMDALTPPRVNVSRAPTPEQSVIRSLSAALAEALRFAHVINQNPPYRVPCAIQHDLWQWQTTEDKSEALLIIDTAVREASTVRT